MPFNIATQIVFTLSTAPEKFCQSLYVYAVGRKELYKTVLCTVRRSEPASKQRHRATTQWAFPHRRIRRVKTYYLRSYANRAVAYCVALLPLFVGSPALTGRLICPQHTFVLGLAVFCPPPHSVHIVFTRVARTDNRVYPSAKWCLP